MPVIFSVHCYNLSSVPSATEVVCVDAQQFTSVFYKFFTYWIVYTVQYAKINQKSVQKG